MVFSSQKAGRYLHIFSEENQMTNLLQDTRYAIRMLLKSPGVSLIAIVTLALGIGANTAIFSVVNGVLLRPLPYKDPERLVALWESVPTHGQWRASPANFFDWKNQSTSFEGMAAFGGSTMTLTGVGEPEQLHGSRVSEGYFAVVGVNPSLGRSFLSEEHQTGKGQVVILGNSVWRSRFGGDPNIINQTVTLDGGVYTVVGVMAPGLYPMRPTTTGRIEFDEAQQQYWLPMSFTAQWASARSAHVLGVVARLKPDLTIEQASAEMNAIGVRLAQEHAANKGEGIIVNRFLNEVIGNFRPALVTLLVAVGLILLIACANIAGLLLAQHASRGKEIAIRAALGAGRLRLVRQFFVEGLLLSLFGTVAGIMLATLGMKALMQIIPPSIPRLNQVGIDWRVLGFTLLLSFVTCLLFGLIPAWQGSKPDLNSTLEQGGRTSGSGTHRLRFRQFLVVAQVGMAVMLVVGAGLLIKSFWRLQQVDPGFQAERVLSLTLTLPNARYSKPDQINHFFGQLNEALTNLPGVESAAIAYDHPLQTNWIDSFEVEGRVASAETRSMSANFNPIGPDYFRTVGTKLIGGRHFTRHDDQDHPGVMIVNEAFVRQYFPGESPYGRRIRAGQPARIWRNEKLTSFEIVGVVRDVKSSGLQVPGEPTYYIPSAQAPLQDMTVLVRTMSDPTAIVSAVQRSVWAIDPNQPISNVTTLERVVSENMAQPRLNMVMMSLFGALALILASVGIYGLLSYAVTQRTREMGIRMALGAQVTDVLGLVLKQGMLLALIGEVVGIGGALALTRLMRGLLFGVTPTDVSIFVLVIGVLTTTALLACWVPARRAMKVDPLKALRYE
jgi:putative ABC transport system permease protein